MKIEELIHRQLYNVQDDLDVPLQLTSGNEDAHSEDTGGFEQLEDLEERVDHGEDTVAQHSKEVKAKPPGLRVNEGNVIVVGDLITSFVLLGCPEHQQNVNEEDEIDDIVHLCRLALSKEGHLHGDEECVVDRQTHGQYVEHLAVIVLVRDLAV
jgi:hypothetical protein